MGGIGKTRAAVEYAWAYRDDYTALLFAQADSPEELRRNLAGLAGPLQLAERETAEEEVRLNGLLSWLGANPGWLLILDNVDVPPALVEVDWLMGRLVGGHVLLTSRLDRFARQIEPLELDVLTREAAADFLLQATDTRRRKAIDDDVGADELAEELGGLALALEQVASTIHKERWGFRQYLEIWRSNREKVVGWARPEITGYHHAVAVTWQTSVDQLTEAGRHLLERLAFLAPDPMPLFLLNVAIPQAETVDLHDALTDLTSVSLAIRNAEGERFAVHRLVQDVTRRSLDEATSRRRVTQSLRWVDAAFTGDPEDVRTWPRLDPLVSHGLSVVQWADRAGITEPSAWLTNQLGLLFAQKSLHAQAEPLYRRTLELAKTSFGRTHPEVATRLNNLAQLLRATSRLTEAERLMLRALEIDEANLGPDHPNVARDLGNLAGLLQATNRLRKAEDFCRRALAIDEKNFGPDDPTVAIRLGNLAELLRGTNRLAEAEPLICRAIAIAEATLGPDHLTLASYLNNHAALLRETGLHDEAERLSGRALAIGEAKLGPDHPTVAIFLANLAELLKRTNRLDKAEPLMRRHLAIFIDFERKNAHPHPHREAALRNYADLLAAMGRSEVEIKAAIANLTGDSDPRDPR
jgi:tetratricopeptide (TPR) repeat protein